MIFVCFGLSATSIRSITEQLLNILFAKYWWLFNRMAEKWTYDSKNNWNTQCKYHKIHFDGSIIFPHFLQHRGKDLQQIQRQLLWWNQTANFGLFLVRSISLAHSSFFFYLDVPLDGKFKTTTIGFGRLTGLKSHSVNRLIWWSQSSFGRSNKSLECKHFSWMI